MPATRSQPVGMCAERVQVTHVVASDSLGIAPRRGPGKAHRLYDLLLPGADRKVSGRAEGDNVTCDNDTFSPCLPGCGEGCSSLFGITLKPYTL